MRVVLNRLCAGTAPHRRGCRLSFLREGTVTIWRRHINARKCQWSDAPQARFKTHTEETEGREEEGGLPELHQWVLGDSVVSKAVKAGWAGFPSCRLNLRLEPRSWTSASTQTDQFCRTKKKTLHVQPLAVSRGVTIPTDWQLVKEKGTSLSLPFTGN